MDWSLSDVGCGKGDADIVRTATIAAPTQAPLRRERPGRCCSPDRGLLARTDFINASCLIPFHVTWDQRNPTARINGWFIGTQADRPSCTAGHVGQYGQGASDPGRGG